MNTILLIMLGCVAIVYLVTYLEPVLENSLLAKGVTSKEVKGVRESLLLAKVLLAAAAIAVSIGVYSIDTL